MINTLKIKGKQIMALTPDSSTLEMMMKAGDIFESMNQIPSPFKLAKLAKVSNMNMGDVKLACGELKQMFDTPHALTVNMFKSLGEQFLNDDYMFLVDDTENDIDWDKIKMDLDYGEPFVLVKCNDIYYAVVHFTVFDKHCNSIDFNEKVHPAIKYGNCKITIREVNEIKSQIQKIKQSQWLPKPESDITPSLVTVVRINV
jgi:hypothetical protein